MLLKQSELIGYLKVCECSTPYFVHNVIETGSEWVRKVNLECHIMIAVKLVKLTKSSCRGQPVLLFVLAIIMFTFKCYEGKSNTSLSAL